jgi:hypothetical protein
MWLKLKQGVVSSGVANLTITATNQSRKLVINWNAHPFTAGATLQHVTFTGFSDTPGGISGITADMMNRTHGVIYINANQFAIVVKGEATATGTSGLLTVGFVRDTHMLGGEPVECRYFSNYVILWSSIGEIIAIDRNKIASRLWSSAIAAALVNSPIGWSQTDMVAQDIFGKELCCSNGYDKPLSIDFTRTTGGIVQYVVDPGNSFSNDKVPAFDACKSAFRFFTIHDTQPTTIPTHVTEIRVAAKDTLMVFSDAPSAQDAVDIDMSKITASPEQTIRGFAIIKDALLIISPTATSMMKLGIYTDTGNHEPQPIDTLNGFGSNAPRSIVEIGSDVFMVDFNGVPSAKLSGVSNAVVPERVSNYIETMMSKHIGRLRKDTMRLNTFGFYDGKNKFIHYYIPKFDTQDDRWLITDPFYFDSEMGTDALLKNTLIVRHDSHQLEEGDYVVVSGATSFSTIDATNINGTRKVVGVINENYVIIGIGQDVPAGVDASGGGSNVHLHGVNTNMIGYVYHYVPVLKLFAWSRFKTPDGMTFKCGCGTIEGRSFLFTPDGYMMRYGSMDAPVYGDWLNMYDFLSWTSGQTYHANERVYDSVDGLVYKCLSDVTTTAGSFAAARLLEPDSWEEYKGDNVSFQWELPWADFGNRQLTKALRFVHVDANGLGEFNLDIFSDNIYKDASNGKLMPARTLSFVPNEAGAYGAGQQLYGGGHRTREQRLWQMPTKFKLMKARVYGSTNKSLSISGLSFMYQRGSMVRG